MADVTEYGKRRGSEIHFPKNPMLRASQAGTGSAEKGRMAAEIRYFG